jgi:hypothetical protein
MSAVFNMCVCACGEECETEADLLDHVREMNRQGDPFPHGFLL